MNLETSVNSLHQARLQWDAADAAKFLMALSIVVLHTQPFGEFGTLTLTPLLRLAVPLYFMISARLFFTRLGCDADWIDARKSLAHFALRTAKLYVFWLFMLLVPTAVLRGWFSLDPTSLVLEIIVDLLFGSTFVASWYLSASVIGLSIIVLLRYRFRWSWSALTALGLISYLPCLVTSSYSYILTDHLVQAISQASRLFTPYNSFPVAVFWLTLGARLSLSNHDSFLRGRRNLIASTIGITVLYFEWAFLKASNVEQLATDTLLCLPLAASPLFVALMNCEVSIRHARELRSSSTIIYCLHGTISRSLYYVLVTRGNVPLGSLLVFLVALSLCLSVSCIIL